MRKWLIGACTAALVACGGDEGQSPAGASDPGKPASASAPGPSATPNPATCEKLAPLTDDPGTARTKPLVLPASLAGLAVAERDRIAAVTLTGKTVCLDARWIHAIEKAAVSPDQRFLSFDWVGYEDFGHVEIDRSGDGHVIETGNPPTVSPDGRRLAAIDLSESGFGGLNAFAVWDILPTGLSEAARVDQGVPPGEWRIDGWIGDDCVNLSLQLGDGTERSIRRATWFAAESNKWQPRPGRCPTA